MSKIVVCEDDPTIQQLVQVALRSTPHQVLIAQDGAEGLRLIEAKRPDLVVSDLAMPRMTGLELLDALKARADLADIPFLILTASTQRVQREEGLRRGAVGYLTKPFGLADLRQAVERHLAAASKVKGEDEASLSERP